MACGGRIRSSTCRGAPLRTCLAAQTARRYIHWRAKSELKKFAAVLAAADGWRTIQEGVEVKLTRHLKLRRP